ncbi:MAG TPA: peptide ABC transporter substrate-binding protein [Candidatus Saccharimonadales bacterium]|nr:peptide ABC transporter substrate-binding protein [Candidatus Saccharimonadales bacterium]
MRLRLLRLRFHRRWRKGQRQVEAFGSQAEQQIDQHLFRRFSRLAQVRRFVLSWAALLLLLIAGVVFQLLALSGYYQTLKPVPGGVYQEGVVGTFSNANPLYATSDVDTTVSHLIFAGLFTYNNHNQLVGDLASGYTVNSTAKIYTVHLKPHLTWQDGRPLTSADVRFTYQTIQDPDAESPLQSSWEGVRIKTPDARTIVFTLPDALASFPYGLTTGIVPQHLLARIPPVELRSADFNSVNPVGAGPFRWRAVQVSGSDPDSAEQQIVLAPFAHYQGGEPKLQEFVVRASTNQAQLVAAFKDGQLTGLEGIDGVPSTLKHMSGLTVHSPLLTAATMVFFKTSDGVLADRSVRQALVRSVNVSQLIAQLGYQTQVVREPLLPNQLAYQPKLTQPSFNLTAAAKRLTNDGWIQSTPGSVRHKGKQTLSFSLTAADTPEYRLVTRALQQAWSQLGVQLTVQLEDAQVFQSALNNHDYQAVLYGISLGVDPDVFVYWDASQADLRSANRLNLSEWKNTTASLALEAGRTRLNPKLRIIKYKPFLQAWQHDTPALGLYQPRLLYLTNGPVAGLGEHNLNTAADRLDNVQNWEIREAKVTD